MKSFFVAVPIAVGMCIPLFVDAQTELDLYRFSNTFNEGSARFESMGGSFGALGADLGCARINPAGFGRYSSSQFSFGFSNVFLGNRATFKGTETNSSDYKFRLSNMGFIGCEDISGKRNGFLYHQFGIGYTGIANFGNTVKYAGQQFESLLDGFCAQAAGIAPEDLSQSNYAFSTSLAYETYAIDFDNSTFEYRPRLTSGDMRHSRTITAKGGMNELFFAYSTNYLNKLYLGANLGVQFIRYLENTVHHEELIDTTDVSLRSFDYIYNLKTNGNGTNLKIGAIYLPIDNVRFGLALHTPTFFTLTDNWGADMVAQHDDTTIAVPETFKPTGNYKYRMRTPGRIVGSFAYIFGTKGCVNIDIEYLDYRWANFRSTTDQTYEATDYRPQNQAADDRFKPVVNIRVGGELVVLNNLFIRGGYGYFPIGDKALIEKGNRFDQLIAGGAGIRLNNWTIDAGLRLLQQTKDYVAFEKSEAEIRTNQLYFVLNAQVKF